MRIFCVLRAISKSTILKKKNFPKSMILNEKVFVKTIFSNKKVFVLSDLETFFYNASEFELKFLRRVRFGINFLNTRQISKEYYT